MPKAAHPHPLKKGDHVFLVDGSSFVFRSYFQSMNQDRKYNYRSDNLPTGAIRLFCTKLYQFIREGAIGIRPTHLAIIFDKSEQSFRKEIYPEYKANRSDPPDDLIPQFPLMREAVRAFGLLPIEQDRYEADDIIATYARQATEAGADALVISADKDLMQIIKPGIAFYDFESGSRGGKSYRPERLIVHPDDKRHWKVPEDRIESVVNRWEGVPPEKIIDVQALAGDSTDNVPGAPGIGIKTAAQLITEYGDLDTLLKRAGEIKQPKRRETLTNPEVIEKIVISKKLVTLDNHVAVETPLEDTELVDPDGKQLIAFLKAMEFTTILKRVSEALEIDASAIDPDPRLRADGSLFPGPVGTEQIEPATAQPAASGGLALEGGRDNRFTKRAGSKPAQATPMMTPPELVAARRAEIAKQTVDRDRYVTIGDIATLDAWIERAIDVGTVGIALITTSPDPMVAEVVGVSLALGPNDAGYVPLGHRSADDLLTGGGLAPGQIPEREALKALRRLFEDPGVLKVGYDIKSTVRLLARRYDMTLSPFDDLMLMSYVLDAGLGSHELEALAARYLSHEALNLAEVVGKGRTLVPFEQIEIARACPYCGELPDLTLRLWRLFKARLVAEHMTTVYETLERPLVPVLAHMERAGIAIDRAMLARLSADFAQTMARLDDEIAELAGERFNLGSPKQLGDILFGKMGLPGASKTPTGAWSTRANVLEELAEQGHELPARILEWRQVSKLKSTYTDALPSYVNPDTNRVHTSYALAATTTGRLSSSEPNLQNIPIRREDGRKIRKAFVAEPGHKLVSADYSQIELRLLAEIADVPALRQAFKDGLDIHAMTASEMFGVPIKDMTGDVRRRAKAINFGIIYGISAFGLANQLGIGREEAGAYIRKYFERFPGIRDYMEATKAACRVDGYVTTLFGRKMHYPEIKAKNPSLRAFNERAAINARLQGTAADIIRRAMIRIEPALKKAKSSARMLLQVHDELIFEVPDKDVEATLPVVKRIMEDAPHPAITLHVPLSVDARAANNWDEAH